MLDFIAMAKLSAKLQSPGKVARLFKISITSVQKQTGYNMLGEPSLSWTSTIKQIIFELTYLYINCNGQSYMFVAMPCPKYNVFF
jgi:uncharacterized protein YjfI (DUF2170 family)